MNEIERCRTKNDEREILTSAYELLSEGFLMLSKIFADYENICRESLLTSFSVIPSRQRLQELESVVLRNRDQIVPKRVELDDDVVPAYYAEVENLNADESVKLDLNTILRYRRSSSLSWKLEWSELKAHCERYLEAFEVRGIDDEPVPLKFLELDYNAFKNIPQDESTGIEKGYEQYVEFPVAAELSYDESESSVPSSPLSSSSFDDPDSDEDYVLEEKHTKKKRKKKYSERQGQASQSCKSWDDLRDFQDWLDRGDVRGDMKLVLRRQKRQTWSIASSDSETQVSKKRCAEKPKKTLSAPLREKKSNFEICIPRYENVEAASPVHGKRVTMQIRVKKDDSVGSTDDDEGDDRVCKPCEVRLKRIEMADIAAYTRCAKKAVRSLVDAASDSPRISSPTAVCSCHETETSSHVLKDDFAVPPIIIRRHVKEVVRGGKRKKARKKRAIFEIITKDPLPEKVCHFHSVDSGRSLRSGRKENSLDLHHRTLRTDLEFGG